METQLFIEQAMYGSYVSEAYAGTTALARPLNYVAPEKGIISKMKDKLTEFIKWVKTTFKKLLNKIINSKFIMLERLHYNRRSLAKDLEKFDKGGHLALTFNKDNIRNTMKKMGVVKPDLTSKELKVILVRLSELSINARPNTWFLSDFIDYLQAKESKIIILGSNNNIDKILSGLSYIESSYVLGTNNIIDKLFEDRSGDEDLGRINKGYLEFLETPSNFENLNANDMRTLMSIPVWLKTVGQDDTSVAKMWLAYMVAIRKELKTMKPKGESK